MTVDVKTIWGLGVVLTPEQASTLNQKLMDMANLSLVTHSNSVVGHTAVGNTVVGDTTLVSTTNSFATLEAANEYIAFVNAFTPPPYSIGIVS